MAGSLLVQPYPAELAAQPCTVAVTGCTGYVAGCIVQRLLALGHTVHGTCRDLSKAKDLQALPGASDRLKLFKADLLQPGSFDEAFKGCDYVVHAASPYIANVSADQGFERLVKPAVLGTENVLAAVNNTPSVKRVVLTSSVAAIMGSPIERGPDHVFTEADWCIIPTNTVLPYYCSKREAEKKAWEIVEKQNRWDLVVINPSGVFGPPCTSRPDGESVDIIRKAVANMAYPACPKIGLGTVDVRDVAAAHTLALFTPGAKGRYICSTQGTQMSEFIKELSQLYPAHVWAPRFTAPKWLMWTLAPVVGISRDIVTHMFNMPTPQFDNTKIQRELGLTFLDRKTTLKDQVEKMKQLGLLPKFRG